MNTLNYKFLVLVVFPVAVDEFRILEVTYVHETLEKQKVIIVIVIFFCCLLANTSHSRDELVYRII